MKKGNKYNWRIGCPPPSLDQHSLVKHRIIESYVREYILTLMSQVRIPKLQLTLVDGFAGGGAYLANDRLGEVDGSPILMMRAVREARFRLNCGRKSPREVAVDYEFIEANRDAVAYLNDRIQAKTEGGVIDQIDTSHVRVSNGKFIDHLPRLIGAVKQKKLGERAIFVLDQYSYMLPMSDIATIIHSIRGAEVLLTFNVGSLITFLANRDANRLPIEKIGLDRYIPWGEIKAIKTEKHWRKTLQRHLALGIRSETGARFATLFFVRPDCNTPWDYWLIHLSNHYKAHEVMKDLHWEHASVFGHELEPGVFMQGYDPKCDEEYTGQESFDFGESSREACVNGIQEHFGQQIFAHNGPVRLRDLIERCAANSPGSTQHFMGGLSHLHRSGDVIVCSADGKMRRPSKTYHLDSIVEASRIFRLFP